MRTEDFDYALPPELIAQTPLPRGESRLLVLDRASGELTHRRIHDLLDYLRPGDTVVLNDTRVSARRLEARRESGEPAEVLLLRPTGETDWEALVRPGRRVRVGATIWLRGAAGVECEALVVGSTEDGGRILRLPDRESRDRLAAAGVTPIPPYIHVPLSDEERYQTVYARSPGSAAAPTAGLHITPDMLEMTKSEGICIARLTLHIGVDTFRPVRTPTLEEHRMHGEWFHLSEQAAAAVNATRGRVVAIGTTAVRALESAAVCDRRVEPACGETRLFITPGFRFRIVDAMLTNFHLPRSTLLALVSAFAGRERVVSAYEAAVRERYRFYSFGDAMLIV